VTSLLSFLGGLVVGYCAAYWKYLFDAKKVQFDFKMRILTEVWAAVLHAKSLSVNLDPELGYVDVDESRQQRVGRRLQEYCEAYSVAKRVVRTNEPFYPREIHDLSNAVLAEADANARLVGEASPATVASYWDRIAQGKDKMDELAKGLSDAIRKEMELPTWAPWRG
jgi:hypothetical protein